MKKIIIVLSLVAITAATQAIARQEVRGSARANARVVPLVQAKQISSGDCPCGSELCKSGERPSDPECKDKISALDNINSSH